MCHQQPYFSGHLSFQLKFIFDNSSSDLVCGFLISLVTFVKKKYFTCDLISAEYYQNDQRNNLSANMKRNVCAALFASITLFAKDTWYCLRSYYPLSHSQPPFQNLLTEVKSPVLFQYRWGWRPIYRATTVPKHLHYSSYCIIICSLKYPHQSVLSLKIVSYLISIFTQHHARQMICNYIIVETKKQRKWFLIYSKDKQHECLARHSGQLRSPEIRRRKLLLFHWILPRCSSKQSVGWLGT